MALAGNAVVAIWNDIAPEGRSNFYEWHNREHMPERLSIDGFLRGRRYRAVEGELSGRPEYFTLYEVRDADVLGGPAYLARLNSPTPWTTRSVSHFRNVARSLCRNDIVEGQSSGGYLGTLRFDCDVTSDDAVLKYLREACLDLAAAPAIVGCYAGRADVTVSSAKTAEQEGRPANAVPRWVVMVEGSSAQAVREAMAGPLGTRAMSTLGMTDTVRGVYALQFDQLA